MSYGEQEEEKRMTEFAAVAVHSDSHVRLTITDGQPNRQRFLIHGHVQVQVPQGPAQGEE